MRCRYGGTPATRSGITRAGRASFFIFFCSVDRFIPSRAAAPFGPATTQPVSRSAARMCSRSASASVTAAHGGLAGRRGPAVRLEFGRGDLQRRAAARG